MSFESSRKQTSYRFDLIWALSLFHVNQSLSHILSGFYRALHCGCDYQPTLSGPSRMPCHKFAKPHKAHKWLTDFL